MANILVVDDENNILEMTSNLLSSAGYKVLTASDGETAIEVVNNHDIDLIILDAVMPGKNGLDVCRNLKRNHHTRSIPIIIFSVLGTGLDLMLEDRDKADAYITKPFTKRILLQKISQLLV